MQLLNSFIDSLSPLFPLLITILISGATLWGANWLLITRRSDLGNERLFPSQLIMLGLSITALIAMALALPVSDSSRNQVIGVIGLVISGVFAFSSSTIFANLMAGLMLRVTKPFRTGDFIKVTDYFGRVVERGLLDTELQTETRELVALPNTLLISNPISVTRSSGTIISTTLSLGYDVHQSKVESLLLKAATDCELSDPFVQIIELGNYAITYKISGMLTDVKSLITVRSNLNRFVLNTLHGNSVEIMSPTFMNQRPLSPEVKILPPKEKKKTKENGSSAEELIFDKAEKAEQIMKEKKRLFELIDEAKANLKEASDEEEKAKIDAVIKDYKEQLKVFKNTDLEESSTDNS
jgi:small-conductance mechanosensitive channel